MERKGRKKGNGKRGLPPKKGTRGEADAGENATIARLIVRSRALTWRPSPPDAAPPSARTRDSQIRRSCKHTDRHTIQYVHFGLIHKYASSAYMHRSTQYACRCAHPNEYIYATQHLLGSPPSWPASMATAIGPRKGKRGVLFGTRAARRR